MFESVELGQRLSREAYEQEVPRLRAALLKAQERLRDAGFSVVVVIAGAEGSGKGDVINSLLSWIDARGVSVHAAGEPTAEETDRPPFFRFWRRLPPRGEIAIFFGSWYTLPIVDRTFDRSDDDHFESELRRIVDFERMLTKEHVLVVKFWLHVTKAQQRKRFQKLEANPDKAWRVTPRDWQYHETYDAFVSTSARALRLTDTPHSPWKLVEARDKRHRLVTVASHLLAALEERLAAPPPVATIGPPPLAAAPETNVLSVLDLGVALDPDAYESSLSRAQGALARLARRLGPEKRSAVLVFEGPDAAGKGGCIRRVVQVLDARFYRVVPIAAPTDEEQARPYLWRFWRHLPRRGGWAIFDRSWYGRVLVERVEGLCEPDAWQRAYVEINAFEEQLVGSGTLVFKFWLAIDPEEQKRRFTEREKTAYKHYKLTPEDWRNREKWSAYETAACDMFERTSTEIAPWTLIEANDKRHARIRVLETLCAGLEQAVGRDEKPRAKRRKHKG